MTTVDTLAHLHQEFDLHQRARRNPPQLALWWLLAMGLIVSLYVALALGLAVGVVLIATALLGVFGVIGRELWAYTRHCRRAQRRLKLAHAAFRAERRELRAARLQALAAAESPTEVLPVLPRVLTPPRPVPAPALPFRPIQWTAPTRRPVTQGEPS